MAYVYHIFAIRVNETSWAHVWRLRFRYLGTGCDTFSMLLLDSLHDLSCGRMLVCALEVPNEHST
jgi:hypothetical protein